MATTTSPASARAVHRHARFSASKARVVLDLIRGATVEEARATLVLSERGASIPILKVLDSAVANAVHNNGLEGTDLFVSVCYADEGATLKRFRPRARGRAGRINKRTCHITIVVERLPLEEIEARRARLAARGAAPADRTAQRARRVARSKGASEETTPPASEAPATGAGTSAGTESAGTESAGDVADTEAGSPPAALGFAAVGQSSDQADGGEAAGVDEAAPYGAGSAAPLDDDSAPEGFTIKGNKDSMLYHTPASRWYEQTVAEVWFDTEEAAVAAGFRAPGAAASEKKD